MSYNSKYNGYSGRYRDKRYRPKHGYDKHRSEEYETRDGSSHRSSPGFSSSYLNGRGSSHGESPSSHHRHDKHGEHGPKSTDSEVKPSSSSSYTPPKIIGTDPRTGENPNDSKFPKLLHHIDFKVPQKPREPDPLKNYKVLYDSELDSSLSKAERKAKSRKLRYNGGDIGQVTDPRASNVALYFQKPNKKSKKFPFKQLPQPKFVFDKDSLGPPPQTELVVWDLPPTTSEVYLSNYFNSYGSPIKDMRFINDPINAVPLGIATFKFQGNPEKAMKLAKNLIKSLKTEGAKIDGSYVKIGLNDHNNELLQKRIDLANEKLRAAIESKRRADEDKRRAKRKQEEEQRKQEEMRKKEEERKKKDAAEKNTESSSKSRFQPNTTITSIREKNKVITGVFLPEDLKKYIKDRPYILIHDKYISTKRIPSLDIKKALNKYDWTRILSDKTGFYIVFNSLSECERCFLNNDGTKFYEYRMFMELCIPEGFSAHLKSSVDDRRKTGKNDIVDEAVNMLIKDFQTFLAKDIRERIIAPTVLDLLSHDKYPELVEELKAKEAKEVAAKPQSHVSTNGELKQNALSMLAKQKKQPLPFFKKKIDRKVTKPGKSMIPMQHALNFDRESLDEDDDEDDDEEDADSSRSVTPVANNLKREHQDEEIKSSKKHKKGKKAKVSFLYDSESETEATPKVESMEIDEPEEEEPKTEEVDYTNIEEKYLPTEIKPATVFPETEYLPTDLFDLDTLQDIIKDEEDMKYALQALENVPASNIKNIDYWAWKQKDMRSTSDEISEDTELIEKLDPRLESKTGSFRSEGYRQIPDSDKIEYLPHRRKVHKPLKTILHENEEDEELAGASNNGANGTNNNGNDTNTNSNHSSRVNRANNRRFAADITAQIGSETEVLSLNTLTKRKKPVSFARSAIHNWGLYALEPIAAKEMIIEYVGESIRQQVAENREKGYLKTGIGSSYLFRVDENTVIDATKKGGIARFINHCCDPSCTAKIIKVEGKKRIVIYALKDIEANEELTYDYKFERETNDEERIRCLCGAPTCKGWLN